MIAVATVVAVVCGTSQVSPSLHPSGPSPTATAAPAVNNRVAVDRVTLVQQVLDTWGAALRSGDPGAVDGVLDPGADPGFVRAEHARTAALPAVPLADWGYEITDGPDREVPPGLAAAIGADEVWAPPVHLRYAIAGADEAPTRRPVGVVFARRGPAWRVLGDTVAGVLTWRGPWDFGPVTSVSTPHGVVLAHPGTDAAMQTLARELRTAVAAVSDVWDGRWSERAVVVLPGSQAELQALVGQEYASPGVAAVTISDPTKPADPATVSGVRVVFNPDTFAGMDERTLRFVLRHELTHAATRAVTSPGAPLWMLEGYADYAGRRGTTVTVADAAPAVARVVGRTDGNPEPIELPGDEDFGPGSDPGRAELAYELSWSFATYFARRHGEQALTALYHSVAQLPEPTPTQLDAAFTGVVGEPMTTEVDGWREWLRQSIRPPSR